MKYLISSLIFFCLLVSLPSCRTTIYGCTDPTAFNYNPQANTNNGSCIPVVYGCTDPAASNYNASANTDDGSCTYTGQVNFWTPTNYGVITVTITGTGNSGTITQYYTSGTPTCGAAGCYTVTLPVGTYSFTATNNNGTTWGVSSTVSFTVNENSCTNEELQ